MRAQETKDQVHQVVSNICEMAMVLAKFQNQLQAIREVLTLRSEFNPQKLFNHLNFGDEELTRTHIMWFMEDNERSIHEQEVKLFFSIYGYKDKISYSEFLNYIYPFDSETIRTISTVNCKKYMKTQEEKVSEEVRCLFLLLIQKEIQLLYAFEEAKADIFPQATRDTIKKSIKQMKKFLPISFQQGIQSDYVLTFKQFKAILKKQKNIPERKAQPICRRLSMQKDNFIGIDQLEIWLKPWNKLQQEDSPVHIQHHTLFDDIEESHNIEAECGA